MRFVPKDSNISRRFGRDPVSFQHTFHKTGLFSDEKLAELIDRARLLGDQYYTLGALDADGYGDKWQTGTLGDLDGNNVLMAIKNGRIWLQLQRLDEIAPEIHDLARAGFTDLKKQLASFSAMKLQSNLLISSPSARVLCHLDCAEVVLWHLRGHKRVYLYDPAEMDMDADVAIENVIMRRTEEEGIPYKESWDDKAMIFDMAPGMAANWPLFWPHRVDNTGDMNVSLQTEFYSKPALRDYGVRFANGAMRTFAPNTDFSHNTKGVTALAKCVAGLAAKKMGVGRAEERTITSKFTVDPTSENAIRSLGNEAFALQK